MNTFRLVNSIDACSFLHRTGLPLSVVEKPLQVAQQKNMIEWNINKIKTTGHGHNFLNDLLQLFMPADE